MPLMRTAMYGQGIQLYCAPTADHRPIWVTSMQHIAAEGRCFALSTNQVARRADYPADYVSNMPDDPEAIVCRGGACLVGPFGDLLAGPLWEEEGMLTAEIDLREIPRAQYDIGRSLQPARCVHALGEPNGESPGSIRRGPEILSRLRRNDGTEELVTMSALPRGAGELLQGTAPLNFSKSVILQHVKR